MKITFTQGIVRYQTDASGNPAFLQASYDGKSVSIAVNPVPTTIVLAHKDTNYLYSENVSVDGAWGGDFSNGIDYFLYWDINTLTGERTFGHTNLVPTASSGVPKNPQADQHWFDTRTNTMKVFERGRWIERVRVFAAKYRMGDGFRTLSDKITSFAGTQVGINNSTVAGAILYDHYGKPLIKGNKTFLTSEDALHSNILSSAHFKLESIVIEGKTEQNLSANTVVVFDRFGMIKHADTYVDANDIYGIIETDVLSGNVASIVLEGVIASNKWNFMKFAAPLYINGTGQLSERMERPGQQPVARVISSNSILFSSRFALGSLAPSTGGDGDNGDSGNVTCDCLINGEPVIPLFEIGSE